jgi:broad specificity polyphosphatase/5'/3'-nucleotidase SurE
MVKTVAISQEAESRKNKVSMEERQGINLDVCNQLQQQQQISNTKDWLQLNFYPHP